MCDHPTHSAPQMKIVNHGRTVFTDKGYRLSKATHGVWEGFWYYEVAIDEHTGHTRYINSKISLGFQTNDTFRLGWSQISGDLQAPCGYDQFSYAYRDSPGTLFHQSRKLNTPHSYTEGYRKLNLLCRTRKRLQLSMVFYFEKEPGDVLGVTIYLPPLSESNRLELDRRMWDPSSMRDYVPIRVRPLEPLKPSEVRFYKNGKDLGVAFSGINFGKLSR